MADEFIIVNLSNVLGYFLEDVSKFVGNFFSGWMLMLSVLTLGFMVTLYFRFFKTTARVISR